MCLYLRFLLVVACLIPLGLLQAKVIEPGVWEVLERCRLVTSNLNDGDSFLAQHDGEEYVFRLYYVDAPETYSTYIDRIRDQARYFSIPEDDVVTTGGLAKRFTQSFLKDGFTVMTKWEDARGGNTERYYAMVKKDGSYLSSELVSNGFARIYGLPTKERWPDGFTPRSYLGILKNSEREAQRKRLGVWALASGSAQVAGLSQLILDAENPSLGARYSTAIPSTVSNSRTGKLNINTATQSELEKLPRIGPALAKSIIAARPIKTLEALVSIPGISLGVLDDFRASVILEEPPLPVKTAIFYMSDAEAYLNQEITVVVEAVKVSLLSAPDGFLPVSLETAYEGESGGTIAAYIPDEFYDSFITYYSQPGREFSGLFYQHEKEFVLVYQRK
jgi:endonuclease YncB( thermonuclease family)